MASIKLELTLDAGAVKANLKKLEAKMFTAASAALHQEHELIMTEAKKMTPVETGALRSSGHIKNPVIHQGVILSEGGFGSATGVKNAKTGKMVSYALFVHERADAFHKAPTSWKFYERPLMDAIPNLDERLARRIRINL